MIDAFPHRVATDASIAAGAWAMDLGDGPVPLPEWLPYWDLSQTVVIRREVAVNREALAAETGLPGNAPLSFVVTWRSCSDQCAGEFPLSLAESANDVVLTAVVSGAEVAHAMTLSSSLVLTGPIDPAPAVAHRRGSILWTQQKRVRIHGVATQFPMTATDFTTAGYDDGSPWHLEIGEDLALPAMGSLLLVLNPRFTRVIAAVRGSAEDRPDLEAVRSTIFAEVGRAMVEYALTREDLEQEWPSESLGELLQELVHARFPESSDRLRRLRLADPIAFGERCASTFGLLAET